MQADSIRSALFVFKKHLRRYGVREMSYIYQIRENAYKRGDVIIASTMSNELGHIYWLNGGPNTDPVIRIIDKVIKPTFIDLRKFKTNKFYARVCRDALHSLWTIPAQSQNLIGAATITLFQEHRDNSIKIDPDLLQSCGSFFHKLMLDNGQVAARFKLTSKEVITLARMADGKTARDIADEFNLGLRAVELRLQNARNKLRARTTTEAVYKALVYGILPEQPK